MAFEEHKTRKTQFGNPYADYEYYGKHSKRTWPSLVFSILIGAGLIYLGWYRWHDIYKVEMLGGTISLTSVEWLLYEVSGKWGVSLFFAVVGAGLIYFGFYNYKRLEKMKLDK